VAQSSDLLHPLSLFRRNGGRELPSFEVIGQADVPEPYRGLLVHNGDMTSRLEAFHRGTMVLEVLHCEQTPEAYRREVVLHVDETGRPVEYGAIEIHLEEFAEPLRAQIVQARLPLGALLNRSGLPYRSEPQAYIKLGRDAVMEEIFGAGGESYYGRCNVLLGEADRELAHIVEVLRPEAKG
jgi:chorismate-pyruvate lyase